MFTTSTVNSEVADVSASSPCRIQTVAIWWTGQADWVPALAAVGENLWFQLWLWDVEVWLPELLAKWGLLQNGKGALAWIFKNSNGLPQDSNGPDTFHTTQLVLSCSFASLSGWQFLQDPVWDGLRLGHLGSFSCSVFLPCSSFYSPPLHLTLLTARIVVHSSAAQCQSKGLTHWRPNKASLS